MSKHTPGPWKAQCPTYNEWHVYSQHHPSGVVTYLRGEFLNETAEANARLIAAAPDLLECAQLLRELGEISEVYYTVKRQCGKDCFDKARAAIAKAEGEK